MHARNFISRQQKYANSVEGKLVVVQLCIELYWSGLGKWRRSKNISTFSFHTIHLGVNVVWDAHYLKGSLVSDGSFTKSEKRAMTEKWVNVEDDLDDIDAEVDEVTELL